MTAVLPTSVEREPLSRTESHAPPRWVRPAVFALLAATAVLYFWDLTASGYGNSFYAAAVQSGTQSWKAWLFGSLDSGNVITVDKPPAALWVATAFARVFGFSSFTVLAPQALMGVASVGILYLTVKRTSGPVAGLFAGAALALTPVAALMFRFNNPDALLVLLMVVGAYCVVRATEKASPRWLALAGVAIGFAFLTKMLQAFLVLPAFALAYLVAAPTSPAKRLLHLGGAAVSLIVSAGWYVALVELWPGSSRPSPSSPRCGPRTPRRSSPLRRSLARVSMRRAYQQRPGPGPQCRHRQRRPDWQRRDQPHGDELRQQPGGRRRESPRRLH